MVEEPISLKLDIEMINYGGLHKHVKPIDETFELQAHDYMILEDEDFKGKIIDVGCGPGILMIYAKVNNPALDITCMDGSIVNIGFARAIAQASKANIELIYGNAPKHIIEFPKYDTVVLNHIIEHNEDLDEFMDWVKNMLTDNGTVFICVPYKDAHWSPGHVHFFDEEGKSTIQSKTTTNIKGLLEQHFSTVEIKVFDEEKIDKRHPNKSRGQLDMFIKCKK